MWIVAALAFFFLLAGDEAIGEAKKTAQTDPWRHEDPAKVAERTAIKLAAAIRVYQMGFILVLALALILWIVGK